MLLLNKSALQTMKQADRIHCKLIADELGRRWGNAFHSLGYDLQYALVCERVLHVHLGRPDDLPGAPSLSRGLLDNVLVYMGLRMDDDA